METKPTASTLPSGGGSYPQWVILFKYATLDDADDAKTTDAASFGDPRTEATSRSSGGHHIRVSFLLDSPPFSSRLSFRCSPCGSRSDYSYRNDPPTMGIVAVGGDSLLLSMVYQKGYENESFLLNAQATGILRRGGAGEEFVVAELVGKGYDDGFTPEYLLVLRSNDGEWKLTKVQIVHDDGKAEEVSRWKSDMVFPIADRLLCWVDLYRGVILCNPFDERPHLLYVSLPVDAPKDKFDREFGDYSINPRLCPIEKRGFWVSDDGTELRFVNISPRCCCGSSGITSCHNSNNAFVITSWTMRMKEMTWVMEAMVDATEFWSLEAYAGLPNVRPKHPLVSMDNPHLIFFVVEEERQRKKSHVDRAKWLVMFDMRSKTMLSVIRYDESDRRIAQSSYYHTYFPSKITNYFTFNETSSNVANKTLANKLAISDIIASYSSRSSSCMPSAKLEHSQVSKVVASAKEIFSALEEIPELACDDLLRAYSILCYDISQHRFRSLMGLPMSLRKRWLLLEIKSITPQHPIVSMDNPDLIFFMVKEPYQRGNLSYDLAFWKIIFDMRSKTQLSVYHYDKCQQPQTWQPK
uniref:DUF1618 domain-containing protein n=1 Tax=Leersia perrieri TaxID=77586 RepID=A0A0D9XPM6_9ORYZ